MRFIYLIRHGKPLTPGGETVCLGRTDLPLCDLGRKQAFWAAEYLSGAGITQVFSSPLRRAYDTAAALGLPVTTLSGLSEMDAGDWDGLTFSQIRKRFPELYERRGRDLSVPIPGAEADETGAARFYGAVMSAISMSEGDIAIVAHAGVIQLLLCRLEGRGYETAKSVPIPYGSVTKLGFEGGRLSVLQAGVEAEHNK